MTGWFRKCSVVGLFAATSCFVLPQASAKVLLAVVDDGGITVLEVGPTSLKKRYRVSFPDNYLENIEWVAGQLVGSTDTDMSAYLISKDGAKALKIPPKSAFEVPNPDLSKVPPEARKQIEPWEGDGGFEMKNGEVWVYSCVWIDNGDPEDTCAVASQFRIWPTRKKGRTIIVSVEGWPRVPRKKLSLPVVSPRQCSAKLAKHGAVTCKCRGNVATVLKVCKDKPVYHPKTRFSWLSPKALYIEHDYCHGSEDGHEMKWLARACDPRTLQEIRVRDGPQDVWMLTHDGQIDSSYGFVIPAGMEGKPGQSTSWVLRGQRVVGKLVDVEPAPIAFAELPESPKAP